MFIWMVDLYCRKLFLVVFKSSFIGHGVFIIIMLWWVGSFFNGINIWKDLFDALIHTQFLLLFKYNKHCKCIKKFKNSRDLTFSNKHQPRIKWNYYKRNSAKSAKDLIPACTINLSQNFHLEYFYFYHSFFIGMECFLLPWPTILFLFIQSF